MEFCLLVTKKVIILLIPQDVLQRGTATIKVKRGIKGYGNKLKLHNLL